MGTGTALGICSSGGVSSRRRHADVLEFLDALETQRRLVARAGKLVLAAHFHDGGIAFGGAGVPVFALPFVAEQGTKGVPGGQTDPDAIGAVRRRGRAVQVVFVRDSHGGIVRWAA